MQNAPVRRRQNTLDHSGTLKQHPLNTLVIAATQNFGQCDKVPSLSGMNLTIGLNWDHELAALHHLTRSTIAVIYCNNVQYGQGAQMQHFCHGRQEYSQAQVPAYKFMSPGEFQKS